MLAHVARRVPSSSCLRTEVSNVKIRMLSTSSSSPKPSHLLSDSCNPFTGLNVNSLKSELRRRGLPVSGRKAQLIDRLVSHDAASFRQMNVSARLEAKGDSSTIDYMHMPRKSQRATHERIKIPVHPEAARSAPEVDSIVPQPRVAETLTTSRITSVSGMNEVSNMNEDLGSPELVTEAPESSVQTGFINKASSESKASTASKLPTANEEIISGVYTVSGEREISYMNEDLGDDRTGSNQDSPKGKKEQSNSNTNANEGAAKINGRDRTVLASIGAGVTAWWSTKLFHKKD